MNLKPDYPIKIIFPKEVGVSSIQEMFATF